MGCKDMGVASKAKILGVLKSKLGKLNYGKRNLKIK